MDHTAKLDLPPAPLHLSGSVKVWRQPVQMLTFSPEQPDKNPMFLERRVYQGSSGKVYPLPFYDRVATDPEVRSWDAIHLENEYLRVMVLPEIGGRIHVGLDKRNGYDFFYRQNVIRPALVGLAGPWVSGGVEFNWPQHHRPATFMPVHTEIEEHDDGAVTVWCSDHDPMQRLKGMHGVTLRPGCARMDLLVRLYNRTPYTQTFLWWANVATKVHERYQSFFPSDVSYVADHAKRAITSFPLSDRPYYGVDYPARAAKGVPHDELPVQFVPDGMYPANDLSWYANIPVPTSYMITRTEEDFFGGYDHALQTGVVHVANHHIVPGKKQWTWGNHEFGYAWDRSLTLDDGPYIELMAGAYTDNQPDFSFLAPWETKSFTQSWAPLNGIGVPQIANTDAALHLEVRDGMAVVCLQAMREIAGATVVLRCSGEEFYRCDTVLSPMAVFRQEVPFASEAAALSAQVFVNGRILLAFDPAAVKPSLAPEAATEPAAPEGVASVEELYLTGLHLEQYRHATRDPVPYWQEALRRDPQHSASLNALGLWHLRRGELDLAAGCFQRAIARLTLRNPNPRDGEPHYNLGIALRFQGHTDAAYDALYKATWNAAWRAPAHFALAEIDASRSNNAAALDHVERCLQVNTQHVHARNLRARLLQRLGREAEAHEEQATIRSMDPLDLQSRWLRGDHILTAQEALDIAFDAIPSGNLQTATDVLREAAARLSDGSLPMLLFALAYVLDLAGQGGREIRDAVSSVSLDYCFPSRIEEQIVLEDAIRKAPENSGAKYLLGLLWYDRRRHAEAMKLWEEAATGMPSFATVWRNLGIARFNIAGDSVGALEAYERALACAPGDGRILYERDQLWKRVAKKAITRLDELARHADVVRNRDDLSVELATLLNQVGKPAEALEILLGRHFQPWEGGEGLVLQQYLRARMLLAQKILEEGFPAAALIQLKSCYDLPRNLSEAKHLLANWSHVDYWMGTSYAAAGNGVLADDFWRRAASQRGDFQQMAVMDVSTMTYWSGMAQVQLRQFDEARATFGRIAAFASTLEITVPRIDYFATSLPSMLLFEDDLALRNHVEVLLLRSQSEWGLVQMGEGSGARADALLRELLQLDPNHVEAADLLAEVARGGVTA